MREVTLWSTAVSLCRVWRLQGRTCPRPFIPWVQLLPLASWWPHLLGLCSTAMSPLTLSILEGSLGLHWVHLGNPGKCSHLKTLTLITSVKSLLPYPGNIFTGSGDQHLGIFRGTVILPTTVPFLCCRNLCTTPESWDTSFPNFPTLLESFDQRKRERSSQRANQSNTLSTQKRWFSSFWPLVQVTKPIPHKGEHNKYYNFKIPRRQDSWTILLGLHHFSFVYIDSQ